MRTPVARLLIVVAAGVLTTVAVAVIPPALPMQWSWSSGVCSRTHDGMIWFYTVNRRPAVTSVIEPRPKPLPDQALMDEAKVQPHEFNYGSEPPSWSIFARNTRTQYLRDPVWGDDLPRYELASGWPARALQGTAFFGSSTSGAFVKNRWSINVTPQRFIPVRPMPSGFAADTLLYASAWFILLSAPPAVRAVYRRRRGACVRCGYDRTGSSGPCAECGAPMQSRTRDNLES